MITEVITLKFIPQRDYLCVAYSFVCIVNLRIKIIWQKIICPPDIYSLGHALPLICAEWRCGEAVLVEKVTFPRIIGPAIADSHRCCYAVLGNYHLVSVYQGTGIVESMVGACDLEAFQVAIFIMCGQAAAGMCKVQDDTGALGSHRLEDGA